MPVICYQCKTNTVDAYFPSTCKCFGKNYEALFDGDEKKTIEYEILKAFLVPIFGYAPRASYMDGFCLGCWTKLFEPRYVRTPRPNDTKRYFEMHDCGVCDDSCDPNPSVPRSCGFRRVEKRLFLKVDKCPSCPFCATQLKVDGRIDSEDYEWRNYVPPRIKTPPPKTYDIGPKTGNVLFIASPTGGMQSNPDYVEPETENIEPAGKRSKK